MTPKVSPLDGTLFGPEQACFGCAPNHPAGFHLRFETEGDAVVTRMVPQAHHQGPLGLMHGGLISTLADETAAWAVLAGTGKFGFTTSFEARFHRGVRVGEQTVAKGRLSKVAHRLVKVEVEILQAAARCFTGDFTFALLDRAAAERLMGPLPEHWVQFCR